MKALRTVWREKAAEFDAMYGEGEAFRQTVLFLAIMPFAAICCIGIALVLQAALGGV